MILEAIKAQTSASHQQLEAVDFLSPLTHPGVTLSHYGKVLRVFYGYFYPLEQVIDRFGLVREYLPDYDTRRKAAALRADLHRLEEDTAAIRLYDDLPTINTPAQAFGSLYVMEGSTLGGRLIAKNLAQALGLDASGGAAFFNGYGPQTGSRWKAFQQAMLRFSADFHQDEEMIDTANETFQKLEQWIRRNQTWH